MVDLDDIEYKLRDIGDQLEKLNSTMYDIKRVLDDKLEDLIEAIKRN